MIKFLAKQRIKKFQVNMSCILLLYALTVITISGCAADIGTALQTADILAINLQNENKDYVLGAGDKIIIKFFYNTDLNNEVMVRPDGKISLQLIGDVSAAGLTPEQLTAQLKSRYTEVLNSSNDTYILAAGDKIAVKFFYNPELNVDVTIRPDGKISLQLIGDVIAAGLTPDELTSKLRSKYAEVLNSSSDTYILAVRDKIAIKFFHNAELNDDVIIRPDGKISLQLIGDVIAAGLTPDQLTSQLKNWYTEVLNFSDDTYVLNKGDKIAIKFFYNNKLNDDVIIRPDGKISLQLIGDVIAAGSTPDELVSLLNKKFSKILESSKVTVIVKKFTDPELMVIVRNFIYPELTIIVKEFTYPELTAIVNEFAAQKIYVGGEVTKPGLVPMKGMLRTLDAVILAGGALQTAHLKNVLVLRYNGLKKADVYSINLNKIVKGEIPDIILRPYDIVYLPKTAIAKVDLFVKQYIYNLLPPNIGFGFNYNLNPTVTIQNK